MPKSEAQKRWEKENVITVSFSLSKNADPDLYDFIRSLSNKSAYLRELVRADLNRREREAAAGMAEILPHIDLKGE